MRVAYIAGPYRATAINDMLKNIMTAREIALKYWKKGYLVICPHTNTAFMDGACSDDTWLVGDLEQLRRSDVVVMCPRWSASKGARDEHTLAKALGKEIIYEEDA